MAEVNTGNDEKAKKGKPKKLHLRVDFTPMVDMNMLLITFFMFCTTLSKPEMMNLVVPTKDKDVPKTEQNKVDKEKTITLLLAEDNIIYYYLGKNDVENPAVLLKTDYSPEGLRAILVQRNGAVIKQVRELKKEKQLGNLSEEDFKEQYNKLKEDKDGQVVVIKPTDASTYDNLVSVLDEMQICSIGIYAIVEVADGDNQLIENYLKNK